MAGRHYAAEVLNKAATWKDTTKRITVYPASGQTGVPTSFNRCQEHPTPFGGRCDPARPTQLVGYVITVQAGGYHAMKIHMKIQGVAFSKGSARAPVDIHRAVRARTQKSTVASSAYDPNLPANAAMLAAKAPLTPTPPTTCASPATSRPPRAASGSSSAPAPGRSPPPDPPPVTSGGEISAPVWPWLVLPAGSVAFSPLKVASSAAEYRLRFSRRSEPASI